jgi:hypothetical protein
MGVFLQPWHIIVLLIVGLGALAVVLPPYWMIFKKAGHSPWLSLLTLFPLVKYIVLWFVALSTWKTIPAREL